MARIPATGTEKKARERAREKAALRVGRLWDALEARDTDSMAPQVRLMVAVHGLCHRLSAEHKAEARRAFRPANADDDPRLRRRRFYKASEAFLVTPTHLRALTPAAARVVATTLWFADFKWIVSAGATHVHFGYFGRYGGTPWDPAQLRSFRLRGAKLSYAVGEVKKKIERTDLDHIEVPYSGDSSYLFVGSRGTAER